MVMKKLIVAAALATAFALPAYAQTATQPSRAQFNAEVQYNGRGDAQRHSVNPAYDVYDHGQYVGSDPDPSIRLQLKRDNERDQY